MEKGNGMSVLMDDLLGGFRAIPSCANTANLKFAVEQTRYPCVMLKMGDINTLKRYVAYIHKFEKKVLVHVDSIKGISRDKAGFHYMNRIGVDGIITMKPQNIKMIKEEEIHATLGVFLVDSASVTSAIQNIQMMKPDSVIAMPMTIPKEVYGQLKKCVGIPILAGGLGVSEEILTSVLSMGVEACAVTDQTMLKIFQERM